MPSLRPALLAALLAAGCGGSPGPLGDGAPVQLRIRVSGLGSGTVRMEPGGGECSAQCTFEVPAGTRVTLTASPAPGVAFAGWQGACSGKAAVCTWEASSAALEAEAGFAPPDSWSLALTGASEARIAQVAQHPDASLTFFATAPSGARLGDQVLAGGALLARLGPGGTPQWVLPLPAGTDGARLPLAAVPGTQDVVALARFSGTVDFGKGPLSALGGSDVAVLRVDGSGRVLWSRALTREDVQAPGAILATAEGEVYASFDTFGPSGGAASFGHHAVLAAADGAVRVDPAAPNGVVGVQALALAADGRLLLTGNEGWSTGLYLHALERDLSPAWRLALQSPVTYSEGTALALGADGTLYLAGTFDYDFAEVSAQRAQGKDAFLLAVSGTGQQLWGRHLQVPGIQRLAGMGLAADGALVLGGVHEGTAFDPLDFGGGDLRRDSSNSELFVARFSAVDGAYLGGFAFGSPGRDEPGMLSVGPAGTVMTGRFYGSVNLGDAHYETASFGGLLLRLAP
jgi:hypothetical protein